ncbi:MAG: bifunctional 4-hydroxy-2-oxoglutarate aldolase/2-dehydro-3-deoxy-phosphogluconate aldolase [Anaerolineales bacterium]|nr:bifunctional 4-hydroxy-2-oxoglutarate aldolase/2-dehydro-3-deoxy-phosphogluconate aldolase [Anaerolineales bacterium]
MNKQDTLAKINDLGLLAVLRGPSPELTVKMVDALVAGGVTGIEITYTTPNAVEVVRQLAHKYGEQIVLGMGTLTEPQQPAEAKAAGAAFLVSPHCEAELSQAMADSGLAIMIGALTPSEVMQAYRYGADVVKVFPGSLGGPSYLKSLRGPFPHIPMMPTGGVEVENIKDWFAAGAVAVGAGSNLCPTAWAKNGRFADITERAQQFCAAVQQARPEG